MASVDIIGPDGGRLPSTTTRAPKGSRYQVRYRTPDGRSRKQTFARKVDADRFATSVEHSKLAGTYVDTTAGRQTFTAFADEWAGAQDWKATTAEAWPYVRARLAPHLGSMPLASIDQLTLNRTRAALGERYARSTVAMTMSYATTIMRAAHAAGRIGRDVTIGLRAPRTRAGEADGKVGPEQVPTRAEALAILNSAPAPYRAAIALGLAGLRVGEVLGLSADRIELERRLVTVDRQLQRVGGELVLTTPKAEKVRTIVVPGLVAVELRRHLRDHGGGAVLFGGRRGTPMMRRDQFYASAWRPALIGADLAPDRFKFHALRHFCASMLLAEGAPLAAVAGHLGDTVETVSRTYVHWLRDDREVPADVLDRVLAPAVLASAAQQPAAR
jgi:integrase